MSRMSMHGLQEDFYTENMNCHLVTSGASAETILWPRSLLLESYHNSLCFVGGMDGPTN